MTHEILGGANGLVRDADPPPLPKDPTPQKDPPAPFPPKPEPRPWWPYIPSGKLTKKGLGTKLNEAGTVVELKPKVFKPLIRTRAA